MVETKKWTLIHGRPSAIPWSKDVEECHFLEETDTECGSDYFCYYFDCRKCLPLLSLDYLNPTHTQRIVFIPHLDCIKTPTLFTDTGYHGERIEFVENYLNRMHNSKESG